MKAVLIEAYGDAENLKIADWATPQPADYEVLIKVAATALNRADLLQRAGKYPAPPGESPILGLEVAGTVVATGSKVTKWQPGDAVCGLLGGGAYAEYAVLHEEMALPIPSGFGFVQAAAIPEAFLTAFQAIGYLANLRPKETILIHAGASGVGTAAIQIAKQLDAYIITTASAAKHTICQELGAHKVIDYQKEDVEQAIGNDQVDVVIDFIGAPYFQKHLNLLRSDGRLIILAMMGGTQAPELQLGTILRKRLKIIGSTLRNRPLDYKIKLNKDFYEFGWHLFETGALRPIIDCTFSWRAVSEAHRYMESNRNKGKIVLLID